MKRVIVTLIATAMVLSMTACGKFECPMCGQEKTGGHKVVFMGEETKVCNDCYQTYKEIKDAFK